MRAANGSLNRAFFAVPKAEAATSGDYTYEVTDGKATMEGATTESLKVQATAARNGYRYRCVIKGLDGTEIISQPITLTVK